MVRTTENSPPNWDNPEKKIIDTAMEQSGILGSVIRRNPELQPRLTDFFLGTRRILIVGGESGNGKSLLVSDIRRLYAEIEKQLPERLRQGMAVITWDRVHQAMFEAASVELGTTIALPKGQTDIEIRKSASLVMGDIMNFSHKYFSGRIIMEAPLVGYRGEQVYEELAGNSKLFQTLIMFSPKTRQETLLKDRIMETSAQADAMREIREQLLKEVCRSSYKQMSEEAHEEEIKRWWETRAIHLNGMIVTHDPDDNRTGEQETIRYFAAQHITPDALLPRPVSRFARRQIDSVLETISDYDGFLKRFVGTEAGASEL